VSFPLHADPPEVLTVVLTRARSLSARGVVIFDLDSTLFDNRPRQVRILREFGQAKGIASLAANEVRHWASGWDMRGAMVNAGLPEADADALLSEARTFWRERFFTSEYCRIDAEIAGAGAYLRALAATQVQIAYVTGRHEPMREGSVEALGNFDMPLPDGGQVRLLMKPTLDETDDDFKVQVVAQVRALGEVIAAFDNEPTHVNGYRVSFPEALSVHLATDHSGRAVALLPGVVSIPNFEH